MNVKRRYPIPGFSKALAPLKTELRPFAEAEQKKASNRPLQATAAYPAIRRSPRPTASAVSRHPVQRLMK
jgi:hypothetical protein